MLTRSSTVDSCYNDTDNVVIYHHCNWDILHRISDIFRDIYKYVYQLVSCVLYVAGKKNTKLVLNISTFIVYITLIIYKFTKFQCIGTLLSACSDGRPVLYLFSMVFRPGK